MTSYPEHLSDFEYVGVHRYFLTFCTFERRRHFNKADHVELVRTNFAQQSAHEHFEIPAYCFMPDHVHLLVEGTQDDVTNPIRSGLVSSLHEYPSGDPSLIHERSCWNTYSGPPKGGPYGHPRIRGPPKGVLYGVSRRRTPPLPAGPPSHFFRARIGSCYFSART
jgi:REP element-mobilizing transposase RayT